MLAIQAGIKEMFNQFNRPSWFCVAQLDARVALKTGMTRKQATLIMLSVKLFALRRQLASPGSMMLSASRLGKCLSQNSIRASMIRKQASRIEVSCKVNQLICVL